MPSTDSRGVKSTHIKRGGGSYTSCICGVLARGEDQFRPIADVLPGNVTAYHTTGRMFHVDNLIDDVVAGLRTAAAYNYPINLVGASMGGMVTAFVVERFLQVYPDYDPANLRVVLVDAPCGLDSLSDANAKFLGAPALGQTIAGAVGLLGLKVPVGDDMFPQWDEITVGPYKLAGDSGFSTVEEARQRVQNITRESLSGHSLSLLFHHTQWMIKVGKNGSLEQAVNSLEGIDVSYIACGMGNSPIKQPVAVDWWKARLPDLQVIHVEATHCGFLQNTPEFVQAFDLVFNN